MTLNISVDDEAAVYSGKVHAPIETSGRTP